MNPISGRWVSFLSARAQSPATCESAIAQGSKPAATICNTSSVCKRGESFTISIGARPRLAKSALIAPICSI
ncbi:MAG: hypothetical protein IBJ15_11160 [Alphaproteobacteria bacterium]|nr:hypothetical protein [Alphaproteobacteria bacterium]